MVVAFQSVSQRIELESSPPLKSLDLQSPTLIVLVEAVTAEDRDEQTNTGNRHPKGSHKLESGIPH